MKPNEFIKKHGWEFAIQLSKMNPHRWELSNGDELSTVDLNPYLDAYELVNRFGGLTESYKYIDDRILPELSRAIKLVEEVGL